MALHIPGVGGALVLGLVLLVLPTPADADHVVSNRVYGVPTDEPAHVTVHYVEVDNAAQAGRVRIFMGDGHVACLNGPIGFVTAPATQDGYIALEWRGCNPNNPVATFTYRLEGQSVEAEQVALGMAEVTFEYDYRTPGAYIVDWRAGTGAGGKGVIVAV